MFNVKKYYEIEDLSNDLPCWSNLKKLEKSLYTEK
jgi:hypothetical protein